MWNFKFWKYSYCARHSCQQGLEHICMVDDDDPKMPLPWDMASWGTWAPPKGKNACLVGCQARPSQDMCRREQNEGLFVCPWLIMSWFSPQHGVKFHVPWKQPGSYGQESICQRGENGVVKVAPCIHALRHLPVRACTLVSRDGSDYRSMNIQEQDLVSLQD